IHLLSIRALIEIRLPAHFNTPLKTPLQTGNAVMVLPFTRRVGDLTFTKPYARQSANFLPEFYCMVITL
ncbi:hypothetical protein, partial [Escherichia coli]|uniref:hypothetical protein n=1 Tax=Escherichia coli TaxID=562 RepID=UPI00227FA504